MWRLLNWRMACLWTRKAEWHGPCRTTQTCDELSLLLRHFVASAKSLALRSASSERTCSKLRRWRIDACHMLLCEDVTACPLYTHVADILLTIVHAGMPKQSTTEGSRRPHILAVTGILTPAGQMMLARALYILVWSYTNHVIGLSCASAVYQPF